jgi:hypothetical protein
MNLLFFLPFGSSTPCMTNLFVFRLFHWHSCLMTSRGHIHINNQLIPLNHGNINSNFQFEILLFLFHYFVPHMTINSYMSLFSTMKTPHSIMLKYIILIITTLVILIILIILTIASPILTIWQNLFNNFHSFVRCLSL